MEYILFYSAYVLVLSVLMGVSTWKLFKEMGYSPVVAFVPFYNYFVVLKETEQPRWWVVLSYFPIVGIIMMSVFHLFLMRKFGKDSVIDKLLTVFLPFVYMAKVNYSSEIIPLKNVEENDKESLLGSLSYGVVFATMIHHFIAQPFTIPTGSMERTLLVGDFLFVNRMSYGVRMPMRPISIPFLQSTIFDKGNDGNPKNDPKSYIEAVKLPYFRLPGFGNVERNDIVVFNYPEDSVHVAIDRKDPYVKRAVAVAGDVLEMKAGRLFINGKPEQIMGDAEVQHSYIVKTNHVLDMQSIYRNYGFIPVNMGDLHVYRFEGITPNLADELKKIGGIIVSVEGEIVETFQPINTDVISNRYHFPAQNIKKIEEKRYIYIFGGLTENLAKEFEQTEGVLSVKESVEEKGLRDIKYYSPKKVSYYNTIFPYNKDWNTDWYGPLRIPKRGDVIEVNEETLPMYERLIVDYEGNSLSVKNGKVLINGKESSKYEVKMDYYFMMGDNRDQSLDSRFFGFVPENHIVGKPVFTWMSVEGLFSAAGSSYQAEGKRIRWDRMFKLTNTGETEKTSYWWVALILLVVFFGSDHIMKFFKKKNQ